MKVLNVLHPLLEDYQIAGSAILGVSLGETLYKNYGVEVDYVASEKLYSMLDKDRWSHVYVPENIRKSRCSQDTMKYVIDLFDKGNYDIIHNNIAQMSIVSALDTLAGDRPVVHTQHTSSILGRFSLNYRPSAKNLSKKKTVRVVCPSERMKKLWFDYIEDTSDTSSVVVIKNGITMYPDLKRTTLSKDSDTYISVGRIEPPKHLLDLVKFCDLYNHKIILVCGESVGTMKVTDGLQGYIDEFKEVCNRRSDIITLYGKLPNHEVRRLMYDCKGYFTLSDDESFGLAAAEATLSGLPLLFREEDATKEFASDKTSVMIPSKDLYRKSERGRYEVFEKYVQEFEESVNNGTITNDKVFDYSKTLGLTIDDCADNYMKLYRDLLEG